MILERGRGEGRGGGGEGGREGRGRGGGEREGRALRHNIDSCSRIQVLHELKCLPAYNYTLLVPL